MKRKTKGPVEEPKPKKVKKSLNNITEEGNVNSEESTNDGSKRVLKNKGDKRGRYEKPLTKGDKTCKKGLTGKGIKQDGKEKFKAETSKNPTPTEKPDWMEFKKKKKELKEKRRAKKLTNIYDVSVKAKKIGEKLRRSDCSEQDRKKLISNLHDLLKNNYDKMIFSHDMSRIIQWVLKFCEMEVKQEILKELKPSFLTILQSKYAKNCVKIILKYGSKETRSEVVSACYGNVVKLLSHSVSAPLLELIYQNWATDEEKMCLKQEFYGDMYKHAKDKEVKTLADVFKTAKDMKTATLTAVKGNLLRILNKELTNSTIVQCVLLEFLNACSSEDRGELIVSLRNSIVELSKTKFGAKIAATCIWHGNNKDRKLIMKALKENVKTVAMSEYGYIVLLALLDSVDDTVLMKKIILSEVQKDLTEIALNEYGKHVILYLVARRNSHYFPPSIVEYLQQGDNNEISKKPADIREKELRESMLDSFLEAIIGDTASWLSNSSIAMVSLAVLKVGSGEILKRTFESIAVFITDSKQKIKEGDTEHKPVEHAGLHMMLKKLIQNDKHMQEKGECTFGEVLVNHLTPKVIQRWIKFNRGCFLLVFLLENETDSTMSALLSKLAEVSQTLKTISSPGAKILLKKLK